MPSGTSSQSMFSLVPSVSLQRSAFDRSHGLKTSFDFGFIIPILVDEALPGDTFSLRVASFGRLATMVHPIMENMWLDFHFFAVPNRLVWDNWKQFMGERDAGDITQSLLVPQISAAGLATGFAENSLFDYMGLPTKVANSPQSSMPQALPMRAYVLIFNEWYRDENLVPLQALSKGNGPDSATLFPVYRRGKRHDYFTSALPWPQKGANVTFPLGGFAPVVATSPAVAPQFISSGGMPTGMTQGPATHATIAGGSSTPAAVSWDFTGTPSTGPTTGNLVWGTVTGLRTDLATASAVTVNQLREAVATQRLLERDARGGTRYTELIRSHFGVMSPDARLQRPEYLGGGSVRFNVNPVAATNAGTFGTDPDIVNWGIGTLGAFGTVSARGIGFTKSFTEHCIILGLVSARADLNYQQGLERFWSRQNKVDYYWPEFATLGEQPIKNKEIFMTAGSVAGPTGVDEQTFGFQERYAEYRYKPSRVTGRLRSNSTATLESWHLAQNFASLPMLNENFIAEQPDVDRVLVVQTEEPEVMLDCFFSYKCIRPMPTYSIPGLGGRL